ncbi:hypothetical protein LJC42_03055 [Eubacteriales bacterium OttesenSCG-928-K08]|nr:hypothetical protein [Eubacteriales bacterium OttesenSCG-928-K08]MDL2288613.1 hypothetical protein [Oscillospiraceae bacterium OttesenSCG-928-F05]
MIYPLSAALHDRVLRYAKGRPKKFEKDFWTQKSPAEQKSTGLDAIYFLRNELRT